MTMFLTIILRIIYCTLWVNSYFIQFSMTQAPCTGNGLMDCACNFINACKLDPRMKKHSNFRGSVHDLKQYIPRGLKVLAKDPARVAEICEPGSIGIFYDCDNRIPIASTIVLTADQYEHHYSRPGLSFRQSRLIAKELQQNTKDYIRATKRKPCYTTRDTTSSKKNSYVEHNWYRELTFKSIKPRSMKCPADFPEKSPIARGHLIAAQYGRGSSERIRETFVYTNAVPQFARLNSGSWLQSEVRLIQWAIDYCKGAPLHIIVGSVPSTFGINEKRFVGKPGFSDFIDIYAAYRVNMPAYMWTAACCYSTKPSFTKSTSFFSKNQPGLDLVRNVQLDSLFLNIGDDRRGSAKRIKLFPNRPGCHNVDNFVKF